MIRVTLDRVREYAGGTYGVLSVDGVPEFVTLEPAWRDNKPRVSCIPPGDYECCQHLSERFGKTYIVNDVPDRSAILFHAGNWPGDTQGCIIVGKGFGGESYNGGVTSSRLAFNSFLQALTGEKFFTLQITGVRS